MLSHAAPSNSLRQSERSATSLDGRVRASGRAPAVVIVSDLSIDGFRVEAGQPIEVGIELQLALGGLGSVSATVVRETPGGYACAFDFPLTAAQFAAALAADNVVYLKDYRLEPIPVIDGDDLTSFPAEDRWSGPARLSILLVGSIVCWTCIVMAVKFI